MGVARVEGPGAPSQRVRSTDDGTAGRLHKREAKVLSQLRSYRIGSVDRSHYLGDCPVVPLAWAEGNSWRLVTMRPGVLSSLCS